MKAQDQNKGPTGDALDKALDDAFGPLDMRPSSSRTETPQQAAQDLQDRINQAIANREALAAGKLLGPGIHPVASLLGPAVDLDVSDGKAAETFVEEAQVAKAVAKAVEEAAIQMGAETLASAGIPSDVPFDGGVPAKELTIADIAKAASQPKKRAPRKPRASAVRMPDAAAEQDGTADTPPAEPKALKSAPVIVPAKEDMFSAQATPGKKPRGAEPGESALVRRDGYGRYKMPHPDRWHALPEDQRHHAPDEPWTRATTFAKSISDTYVLDQWTSRMVAKGIALRPDLRALAAATPLEDRNTLNKVVEDAKSAAGARVRANLGTAMHAFTEAADRGEEIHADETEMADVNAYRTGLAANGVIVLPDHIEQTVFCPEYGIVGTLDRIVQHDGELVIGDVKTGRDLSYGWAEIAIQLAIYANASHIYVWTAKGGYFLPMPKVSKTRALVFHLPVGEATCTVYEVDISQGWEAAGLCYRVREWRKTKSLARPLSVSVAAPPEAVVTPPTPMDRVRAATTKGELSALWKELQPAGLWTPELERAGKDQLAKFATA